MGDLARAVDESGDPVVAALQVERQLGRRHRALHHGGPFGAAAGAPATPADGVASTFFARHDDVGRGFVAQPHLGRPTGQGDDLRAGQGRADRAARVDRERQSSLGQAPISCTNRRLTEVISAVEPGVAVLGEPLRRGEDGDERCPSVSSICHGKSGSRGRAPAGVPAGTGRMIRASSSVDRNASVLFSPAAASRFASVSFAGANPAARVSAANGSAGDTICASSGSRLARLGDAAGVGGGVGRGGSSGGTECHSGGASAGPRSHVGTSSEGGYEPDLGTRADADTGPGGDIGADAEAGSDSGRRAPWRVQPTPCRTATPGDRR